MVRTVGWALLGATVIASAALAQMPAAPPAAPASAAPPTPRPPPANDIPLALALEAAQSALSSCKANGINLTVLVMDRDLGIRVLIRADGASDRTPDFARRKAYTVIKTGKSTTDHVRDLGPLPVKPGSVFPDDPSGDPMMLPAAGGLPVRKAGTLVGAVAVGGAPTGEKDDACAAIAVSKIEAALK